MVADRLIAARAPRGFVKRSQFSIALDGFFQRDNVKGLYIYGGVGRGKTMLMDMFHESAKTLRLDRDGVPTVWRLHFHDFMVLAQDFIHAARQTVLMIRLKARRLNWQRAEWWSVLMKWKCVTSRMQ